MGINRWIEEIKYLFASRKNKVLGLALSGGATRGSAHIGVLRVLEREGIYPSIVTGTSAGAIVGAGYAAGISAERMSDVFQSLDWPILAEFTFGRRLGIFNTQPMEGFIEELIGAKTFNELPRNLAVVACDIVTGERVILKSGQVSKAVRASAAVPGLFMPVDLNGQMLVDGGIVDNFPTQLAYEMGADYVIGVDLTSLSVLQTRPSNPIEVIFAANNIRSRNNMSNQNSIDCYIAPDTHLYSGWEFKHSAEMERAGIEAAEKAIPQLLIDLGLQKANRI